jgi:hypothetical protein
MTDEPALNIMRFFDRRIHRKNPNTLYKPTIKKDIHLKTGECYLNYLFSNNYVTPFIKKNYMYEYDYKKSFTNKLNIFNFKSNFTKKKILNSSENDLLKRMLNILSINSKLDSSKIKHRKFRTFKNLNINYNLSNDKSKPFQYDSDDDNKGTLPNINNKNKTNTSELSQDILKNISYNNKKYKYRNTNNYNYNSLKSNSKNNSTQKNKYKDYSPTLDKSMEAIFKDVENKTNLSIDKSKYIRNGIDEINNRKLNVDFIKTDFPKKKNKIIKKPNDDKKKYFLINLFSDIGKIKGNKEIEKILFANDENINSISKLRLNLRKNGIKREKHKIDLSIDSDEK